MSEKDKNKFVIDEEKIKANQTKKAKNQNIKEKPSANKKTDQKEKKVDKLWVIQECSSSEDETVEANKKNKKKKKNHSEGLILDISDIDKSFKIKKTLKRLEDGSTVEVFLPEMQNMDEEEASE